MTLTMLFASIQGPSGDRPRSICDSKPFASLVNLTDGRACSPTSCRMSTDALSLFITLALHQTRVSRCHHRALDNRRVANHNAGASRFGQHFNRHLAIGFCATEVDQNGDTSL